MLGPMQFKRTDFFSSFKETGHALLISPDEVQEMIRNTYLHDQRSLYIVTPGGDYDDSRSFIWGLVPARIKHIEAAYKAGQTIIIKDLEHWNERIADQCSTFQRPTNVHLYLSPPNGTGFGWHAD